MQMMLSTLQVQGLFFHLYGGKVNAWGPEEYGGSISISAAEELKDAVAVTIVTTAAAMAALTAEGNVVAWGSIALVAQSSVSADLVEATSCSPTHTPA